MKYKIKYNNKPVKLPKKKQNYSLNSLKKKTNH